MLDKRRGEQLHRHNDCLRANVAHDEQDACVLFTQRSLAVTIKSACGNAHICTTVQVSTPANACLNECRHIHYSYKLPAAPPPHVFYQQRLSSLNCSVTLNDCDNTMMCVRMVRAYIAASASYSNRCERGGRKGDRSGVADEELPDQEHLLEQCTMNTHTLMMHLTFMCVLALLLLVLPPHHFL